MWAGDSIRCGHLILFDVGGDSVVMWADFSFHRMTRRCRPTGPPRVGHGLGAAKVGTVGGKDNPHVRAGQL